MLKWTESGLRSDATNAYDLLADVCQAIREEPARYNQETWLEQDEDEIRDILVDAGGKVKPPACGTMACRAGWIATLSGAKGGTEKSAVNILGCNGYYSERQDFELDVGALFSADAVIDECGLLHPPEIGTPEYAEIGARGVERFMARWESRLRATPVGE